MFQGSITLKVESLESKMNVNLSTELEHLVQLKLNSGRYTSANEVVRDALHLMAERDELLENRKQELQSGIAKGLNSLQRGEGIDGDEFFAQLERDENDPARTMEPA